MSYPMMKSEFSAIKTLDSQDERYQQHIREHGGRVLNLLGNIVENVEQPDLVIRHLHELGTKHLTYDAKADYIDVS